MNNVLDTLSDEVKKELIASAMEAADTLGYCDETYRVLEHIGFDIPTSTVEVTVSASIDIPYGQTTDGLNILSLEFVNDDGECFEPVESEIVAIISRED